MAKPTEAQRNRITDSLAAFFTSQSHQVLGRINDGADDWWGDNWDDDLTSHLHPLAVDTAAESGDKTADHLGSTYNRAQTSAYLEQVARSKAETINGTTRQQLEDTLASDEPDPQHVFDIAGGSRADGIGFGLATYLAGFGTREAASQHAFATGGTATKTWATGDNPRPSHADLDGETVGLDDSFSNGSAWPGDGADGEVNCNCSIDVEVDVPNAQNRAAHSRFFAKARTVDRAPLKVEALAPGVATMRLYDVIDSWGWPFGISANDFAQMLDELPENTTQIQLHINSPGGESTEALAITNMLRSYPAEVVCIVDGLAASAASVIACGAGRLVMLPNTQLMIHDAWGVCIGNAADMAKCAELLHTASDNIAAVYASKAGGTVAEWRAAMVEEAWMNADEAVAAGLADEIGDPAQYPMAGDPPEPASKEAVEELAEMFDLSPFKYQGRAKAPTPKTPVASASGHTSKEGDATMAFTDDVRQRLGVTDADADEAAILAALDEVLAEQETTPLAKVPDGMVLVSKAKLDEDHRAYDALAAQVAPLVKKDTDARHEGKVLAALRAGKIMPVERQAYLNALAMDEEGTTKRLNELAPGLVPFAVKGYDDPGAGPDIGSDNKVPGWSDALFPELHPEQKAS